MPINTEQSGIRTHRFWTAALILAASLFLTGAAHSQADSPGIQRAMIESFKKGAAAPSAKAVEEFETAAGAATGDQLIIAGRIHTFLDEAARLRAQSKDPVIAARLQGLFWFCYRAGEYDLALAVYQALAARSKEQTIPADLNRARQEADKRVKAAAALIPQIAQADKSGDIARMRELLQKAAAQNARSPDLMTWQARLFAQTSSAQNALATIQKAYETQDYAAIAPLVAQLKTEATKTPGLDSFVAEAEQLAARAQANINSARDYLRQAGDAEAKGLSIDAAQMATEALRLDRNLAEAAAITRKYASELNAFNDLTAKVNEALKQNHFSEVRNLYAEMATLPSSQKAEFQKESARYGQMAQEQIEQMKALSILLEQGRFIESLPGIKKWVPATHQRDIGVSVGRELDKQKDYDLALKYYELTHDTYLINRARDQLAKQTAKLDSKTLLERHGRSVVKISALIDENSGQAKVGTGFFVSRNGYIVTNWHVIDGAKKITVILDQDQQQFTARLVEDAVFKEHDVALLKADGLAGEPLRLGDSESVDIGDTVFTVGNPLMTRNTITEGKFSGKQTGAGERLGKDTVVLVAGLPADVGNSGGPFFNEFGEVIGVVTGGAQDTRITLAVDVKNFSEKIQKYLSQ